MATATLGSVSAQGDPGQLLLLGSTSLQRAEPASSVGARHDRATVPRDSDA